MKIIFLDIDGVLNNTLAPGVMHWNSTLTECVDNLNFIVDSTDAKIIVISSWVDDIFFENNNEKLARFLYERRLRRGSIIDFRRNGATKEDGITEIVHSNESIESFVIIDDNPDIVQSEFLKSRHFITQSLMGLTKEDVQKVINLLME